MIFYITIFIISIIFVHFAGKKTNSYILHFFALTGPILIMSLRDQNVGTDTPHYVDMYDWSYSANSLLDYLLATRIEPLFATLLYVCSHNNLSLIGLYFTSAVLSILPVYYVAIKNRNEASPVLVMFIFYMLFCPYAFNIMRQSIATAFLVLALHFLLRKEYIKTYLFVLIAFLNHYISICFLPIVLFIQFRNLANKKAIAVFVLLFVLFLPRIIPLFDSSLDYYQGTYMDKGRVVYQSCYVVEMLLNFLLVFWAKRYKKYIDNYSVYLILSFLTLIAIGSSTIAPYIYRIAIMLDMLMLIYMPQVLQKNNVCRFAYVVFAIFFFWFVFVYNKTSGIVPYHSTILGV